MDPSTLSKSTWFFLGQLTGILIAVVALIIVRTTTGTSPASPPSPAAFAPAPRFVHTPLNAYLSAVEDTETGQCFLHYSSGVVVPTNGSATAAVEGPQ